MKYLLPLLLLCIAATDDDKPAGYARQSDTVRDGLKGKVRTEEVLENNGATFKNGAWDIRDTNQTVTVTTYDKKGDILSGITLQGKDPQDQFKSWRDEDGIHNSLRTENGNDEKRELIVREFTDDTTLLIKSYLADEDTLPGEQLEEEIRTYTAHGYRRDMGSVSKGKRRRYLYTEKRFISADTFMLNYYGDHSTRFTNCILQRDPAGNPTRILSYTETDTLLTVKKYSYY